MNGNRSLVGLAANCHFDEVFCHFDERSEEKSGILLNCRSLVVALLLCRDDTLQIPRRRFAANCHFDEVFCHFDERSEEKSAILLDCRSLVGLRPLSG